MTKSGKTPASVIMNFKLISLISLAMMLFSFSEVIAQELPGVLVKDKFKIQFEVGHSCMTQTRAATKEEALYTTNNCGAVKYSLTKKGKRFTIFEKDGGKWTNTFEYTIQHSFMDEAQGDDRYTFLTTDGSSIVYIPETGTGSLVILDLVSEDVLHFIYE